MNQLFLKIINLRFNEVLKIVLLLSHHSFLLCLYEIQFQSIPISYLIQHILNSHNF